MKTLFIENTSSMADDDGNYHVFKHVQMADRPALTPRRKLIATLSEQQTREHNSDVQCQETPRTPQPESALLHPRPPPIQLPRVQHPLLLLPRPPVVCELRTQQGVTSRSVNHVPNHPGLRSADVLHDALIHPPTIILRRHSHSRLFP